MKPQSTSKCTRNNITTMSLAAQFQTSFKLQSFVFDINISVLSNVYLDHFFSLNSSKVPLSSLRVKKIFRACSLLQDSQTSSSVSLHNAKTSEPQELLYYSSSRGYRIQTSSKHCVYNMDTYSTQTQTVVNKIDSLQNGHTEH